MQHGQYRFQDFLTRSKDLEQQSVKSSVISFRTSAEDLFFFDTETTGLGGGVGNTIFLLGMPV